jgi:hypothetical protein
MQQPATRTDGHDALAQRIQIMTTIKILFITLTVALLNLAIPAYATQMTQNKSPITIFAIFHDEVPYDKRQTAYTENIFPFIKDFEGFTGRQVNIVFDRNAPPYSNFNYKSDDLQKLMRQWNDLSTDYLAKRRTEGFSIAPLDRVLLITNGVINGSPLTVATAGVALQPGRAAIASLIQVQNIAHELGHTFNANHEAGEVLYNGWWCETFMFPPLPLRYSCFRFSEENKTRINYYLKAYN